MPPTAALAAVAFLLSLFAEVWVIDDGYANEWERYNTVFKIYNVSWLVYGVCFAAALFAFLPNTAPDKWRLPPIRKAWPWGALAVWLAMSLAYPLAATAARWREHSRRRMPERVALPRGPRLDALRYYASVDRDEYRILEWIEENVAGRPVVAEGCLGKSAYTLQGRIATFTGVRTVLAWPQHEANWRNHVPWSLDPTRRVPIWKEMSDRINDLKDLYQSADEKRIRAIVRRYEIDYILVGRLERALYGSGSVEHLRRVFEPAIQSGETVLLRTGRSERDNR